jgi:hypothetical protein
MRMRTLLRLVPAALLGVGAAVLVACGSSGKGLIPTAYAGPLQSDFQAVVRAAQEGNGDCSATDAQIRKTERDLHALPASVDGGLRGRLEEGVENLAARARVLCSQPLEQTTTTATTPTTTTPPPATATTPAATTPTTPTTPSTEAPSEEEGGTQAPGEQGRGEEESEAGHGDGSENGDGAGGVNPGETGAGEVNGGTAGGK